MTAGIVELLLAGGAMVTIDRATGEGCTFEPDAGAITFDAVDLGLLTPGDYLNVRVRRRDGSIGRLTPGPRLLAVRDGAGPWRWAPGWPRPERVEPRQAGRWVTVGQSGRLYVTDRAAGTVTQITPPWCRDRKWRTDADADSMGSVVVPILWEAGARLAGETMLIQVEDQDLAAGWTVDDDGQDIEPARDPVTETIEDWACGRAAGHRWVVAPDTLADDAVFLPADHAADYWSWGGCAEPHDSPEWADGRSLPGWEQPARPELGE